TAVARARESAPDATALDHAAVWGASLAPEGDPRRTTRARVRAEAMAYWSRGQWRMVDRALSALVALDTGDVSDRVRVIEARVRDGRPRDAAHLVAGVPVGEGTSQVSLAVHAGLWLMAARPDLAREEASRALATDPADGRAALVLGQSLLAEGTDRARGLSLLAG